MRNNTQAAFVAAAILVMGVTPMSQAQAQAPRAETECRLKYMRNTKSEAARSYIVKACNYLGLPTADSMLGRNERTFHDCILEVMSGTEDDRNAVQLANACRERAWPN